MHQRQLDLFDDRVHRVDGEILNLCMSMHLFNLFHFTVRVRNIQWNEV